MRCAECLPLIEEYFDGEVDERTGLQMRAHFGTCADCAAALDALSFEQEIYARYDRGLEVSPTLWARVSAEIAREPLAESHDEGRRFLTRLRHNLFAALGALNVRPALASALALLIAGIIVGSLWLTHRPQAPAEVAENAPVKSVIVSPTSPAAVSSGGGDVAPAASPLTVNSFEESPGIAETYRDNSREYAAESKPRNVQHTTEVDVATLLVDAPAAKPNPNIVFIRPDDHAADAADNAPLFVNASASAHGTVANDARLLDPAETELARHVEQAQMLLRSFKNARPTEGDTVNVAYERKLSRRLLAENATLQLDAETRGDKDTKQVLDSIEPFLLDIANLREQPSREEVRSIRERVRKNEIIAALQVY
jgi:hypothetical protein